MELYRDKMNMRRMEIQKEKEKQEQKMRDAEKAQECLKHRHEIYEKNKNEKFRNECKEVAVMYLDDMSFTDDTILSGFTEDLEPEIYVKNICKNLCSQFIDDANMHRNHTIETNDIYIGRTSKKELFTIETVTEGVKEIILSLINNIYQQRLQIRKHNEKLQTIKEINQNVMLYLKDMNAISHTFVNLTMDDWEQNSPIEFLIQTTNYWMHYSVDLQQKGFKPCYSGMPTSFELYYEEGKVPFLTKCPKCNNITKFNYVNMTYMFGNLSKHNYFYEVYCDNHYFYDFNTNKHYISDQDGQIYLSENRPQIYPWIYECWQPSKGENGTKWNVWDPRDPDRKKAEEQERQQKLKEIQNQIDEYQEKIIELNKKLILLHNT